MNTFTGIRDLDLYILQKLDDRSVLNFLIAFPNLNTEENIAPFFGRRYPELVKFKRSDESLKGLYLRMLKYIGLLREEYGTVYRNYEQENPILLYGIKKYGTYDLDVLLIRASRKGDLEIVRTSLESGANIHVSDDYALISATMNGHLAIVQYLIEKGANIHARNNGALTEAAFYGHLPIVKYLVERGADIHAANNRAFIAARKGGHLLIMEYLESVNKK